jgi:threonyl-tRNA synthetase
MLIIGQKEVESNSVTIRQKNSKEMTSDSIENFILHIKSIIKNKKLEI